MTCPSCKSTWESKQQLEKCPFCGASLKQSSGEIHTVTDAIRQVMAERGPEVLKTPKVIRSLVMDYVHDYTREKRLLSIAIDSDAFELIQKIYAEKNQDQRTVLIKKNGATPHRRRLSLS